MKKNLNHPKEKLGCYIIFPKHPFNFINYHILPNSLFKASVLQTPVKIFKLAYTEQMKFTEVRETMGNSQLHISTLSRRLGVLISFNRHFNSPKIWNYTIFERCCGVITKTCLFMLVWSPLFQCFFLFTEGSLSWCFFVATALLKLLLS